MYNIIISNTFSDMMYLNKAHNFCFIFYIPQCFTKISPRLWIEAAFDGEVPQPLYGVGISGEARGTSPAATPVNASGVGVVFFVGKILEEKKG